MGHVSILLDEMGLDKMGLDEMGINLILLTVKVTYWLSTKVHTPVSVEKIKCTKNESNLPTE